MATRSLSLFTCSVSLILPVFLLLFLLHTTIAERFHRDQHGTHGFLHRNPRAVDQKRSPNATNPLAVTAGVDINVYQQGITRSFSLALTTSTASVEIFPDCVSGSNSSFKPGSVTYIMLCDVDFPGQDILPFLLVSSFGDCVSACDRYNDILTVGHPQCLGVVFVPGRVNDANDCYLKSDIAGSTSGTVPMIAAITASTAGSSTSSTELTTTGSLARSFSIHSDPVATFTTTAFPANSGNVATTEAPSATSTASAISDHQPLSPQSIESSSLLNATSPSTSTTKASPSSTPLDTTSDGSGTSIVQPVVVSSKLLGPSIFEPSLQWVNHTFSAPPRLHGILSPTEINTTLITGYGFASDTGTLTSNKLYDSLLAPMSGTPHLARDCGKGGYLSRQNIFIFCDTASYTTTNSTNNGEFVGFVSNSVAVDVNMNALSEQPLTLKDGVGQWSDDVGRLRGFVPMTTGEEAFNKQMANQGYRYAIWPQSSLIAVDNDSAVIYANLVYDSNNSANFTYIGNTLLKITAGDTFGPTASRTSKLLFRKYDPAWGSLGGFRSWGSSGIGGTDGHVYVFAKADQGGILVARCDPSSLTDRSKYEYWTGESWSSDMPAKSSSAAAARILDDTPIMDLDLIYSPRHRTFIVVYMTTYADNTLYYRFLNSSSAIIPQYAPAGGGGGGGGNSSTVTVGFGETILRLPWSSEQILYNIPKPAKSFAYAGSVHQGYFGDEDDITNGGKKMLVSWTANTGLDAASPDGGYALMTAVVEFN